MPQDPTAVCVACGAHLATPFCSTCGEKRASDRKHSLTEFAAENVEALTSFDGRAIRTYRLLLTRPGELTVEFIRGVRQRYLSPLQCFLIVNVLFFLWSSGVHQRVLDARLTTHTHNGMYGKVATRLISQKIAQEKGDTALVVRQFETITAAQARSLVLVMVPLFAAGIALLTVGRKRYAVQHLAFSLHFYSFLLVLFMAIISFFFALAYTLPRALSARLFSGEDETMLLLEMFIGISAYLWIALRRVYALGAVRSGITAAAASFLAFIVFMIYRALIFFTTIVALRS